MPPRLTPRDQRLLAVVKLSGVTTRQLAERLSATATRISVQLSLLRQKGIAWTVSLYCPARLGRPLHGLTYVGLRRHDAAAIEGFEASVRADPAVSQAVLLAGRCDYALWSWHAHERDANDWRRELLLRPQVARTETRFVKVLFGHPFQGALVFAEPHEDAEPRVLAPRRRCAG